MISIQIIYEMQSKGSFLVPSIFLISIHLSLFLFNFHSYHEHFFDYCFNMSNQYLHLLYHFNNFQFSLALEKYSKIYSFPFAVFYFQLNSIIFLMNQTGRAYFKSYFNFLLWKLTKIYMKGIWRRDDSLLLSLGKTNLK